MPETIGLNSLVSSLKKFCGRAFSGSVNGTYPSMAIPRVFVFSPLSQASGFDGR